MDDGWAGGNVYCKPTQAGATREAVFGVTYSGHLGFTFAHELGHVLCMQDINDARDPAIQVAYEPLGAEEYVMVERYPPDDAVVSFQKAPGENSIGISTEASGSRRLTDFASCINALSLSAPNHYIATEYSSAYSNCFSYTIDSLYMGGLGDGWMIESDRPRMMYKWRDETMMESFSIKVNAYINPKFANSGDAYAKEIHLLDAKNKRL